MDTLELLILGMGICWVSVLLMIKEENLPGYVVMSFGIVVIIAGLCLGLSQLSSGALP